MKRKKKTQKVIFPIKWLQKKRFLETNVDFIEQYELCVPTFTLTRAFLLYSAAINL